MSAVHLYLTTCRYVLQAEEYVAELYGLLSYLRQVLSCCVCGHLLRRPLGMKPNVCQHFVCTECSGNKMKLKPSCSWCKDTSEFVENTQITILVHCFKKLCEYLYSSRLVHDLIQSNGETNGLVLLVQEAIAYDDNYSASMEGKLSVLPYMELLPSQTKQPSGNNTFNNKLSQQPTSSNNNSPPFMSRTSVPLFSTKIKNTNDEMETTSKNDTEKQSYFISSRNPNKSVSNTNQQKRSTIVQSGNVREKCAPIERRKRSLWNSRGELACLEPGRHEEDDDDDDDKGKNSIELKNKQTPAVRTSGNLFLNTDTSDYSRSKKIKLNVKESVDQ